METIKSLRKPKQRILKTSIIMQGRIQKVSTKLNIFILKSLVIPAV